MRFVPSIITVYLPKSDEMVEPESIHQASSIPETFSIHKFVREANDRGGCNIEFFKMVVNQEAFHIQWYKKASDVVCGYEKSNKSDSECSTCREWYTGVNGYNVPFMKSGFMKHAFTFKSNF